MTKYNPGDHIPVEIGKKTFDTFIDDHGVQRFVPNTIIEGIVDNGTEAFNAWLKTDRRAPEPWNLNTLVMEYAEGKHTKDDLLDFYTGMGYSVSGLSGLSYFAKQKIKNPVWDRVDA
jgi:hypothetical protein